MKEKFYKTVSETGNVVWYEILSRKQQIELRMSVAEMKMLGG